jgi:hypothetical protein
MTAYGASRAPRPVAPYLCLAAELSCSRTPHPRGPPVRVPLETIPSPNCAAVCNGTSTYSDQPRSYGTWRGPTWPWSSRSGSSTLDGPLGEKPGWRGYALPQLQTGRPPLDAALILALFVALWHVPLVMSGQLAAIGLVITFRRVRRGQCPTPPAASPAGPGPAHRRTGTSAFAAQ